MTSTGRTAATSGLGLLAVFLACAFFGGAAGGLDAGVAAQATAIRMSSPGLYQAALIVTDIGSAPFTLSLGVLGTVLLAARRQHVRAAILIVTVIGERLAVDGLKLFFARARPAFDTDLVHVYNLSFPSGHSANSLTAYLLFACLVFTSRFRTTAIVLAFAITFIVGLTRLLIGVHWLSDVVGGWSAGLIAVMLALAADRRLAAPKE